MDGYRYKVLGTRHWAQKVPVIFFLLAICLQPVISQNNYLDTIFEFQGHQVYLSVQRDSMEEHGKPLPVLMAIHGSGRNALNYRPNGERSIPFYVYQRDRAVQNGYLFVVISNGKDTWGTDQGLNILREIYNYVNEYYRVEKKWTLWATSAGGLQMYRMIRNDPEKVGKALGIFPVYDLMEAYQRRRNSNFVWKDPEEFQEVNPARFPEYLTSVPILIFHGRDDTAVPYKFHSLRLEEEVNALGGQVELVITNGGHSTDNWAMYQKEKIDHFLSNQN